MKKQTFALYFGNRGFFPEGLIAGAREEMLAFAKKTGIPAVATMMGLGVFPGNPQHMGKKTPVYLGMIGRYGRSCANRAVGEADLILLCGARVGDRAIAVPNQIAEQAKVVHIDIDPAEIGKNMRVDVPIVGDIKQVLSALTAQAPEACCPVWAEQALAYRLAAVERGQDREDYVEPRSFLRELSWRMEEDSVLAADPGQGQIWAAINFTQREGRFLTSGGLGTMGYALPAAVGAKVARPDRQTVVVCGDGSFQMAMNELAAIRAADMDIKIVLFRNHTLGLVHQIQSSAPYHGPFGVALDGSPDFETIAAAYRVPCIQVGDEDHLDEALDRFLGTQGSCLLICEVHPDVGTND